MSMAGFNYNEQVWQRLYDWQSLTYLLLGTLEKSWWFSLYSIAESQEQRSMGADSLCEEGHHWTKMSEINACD